MKADQVSYGADDMFVTADGSAYLIWTADTGRITCDSIYYSADMATYPRYPRAVEVGYRSTKFGYSA